MTPGGAKTLTVAAVGTAAVLASLEHVAAGRKPPLTVYVGAGVAGVVLLAVADLAPPIAAGLAGLLLAGALLRNGSQAASTLTSSLDRK